MGEWLLRNCAVLARELSKADAVHAPIPGDVGTIGILGAMLLQKPLFVRHCGNWLKPKTAAERLWRWGMERCAGGRNVMLATGGADAPPSARNSHLKWIFSTSLTVEELRECANRPPVDLARPRLAIACRQVAPKGTGRVIEALPLLQTSHPEIQFDVLGDGPDLTVFREQAARLGIESRVVFHGKVDHDGVIQCLRRASLFCFPTTSSEGFPKAVLEALACGLPVVTTRVSVLPALLRKGAGVLLDDVSPQAIAAAVRECLDPSRYELLSQQAIETAQAFSLESWRDTIGTQLTKAWGRPLRSSIATA
jgi:glycosyltransferase involved in cell wall biosynthesis